MPSDGIDLVSAKDFYNTQYRKTNRLGWIVITIISLALSAGLTWTVTKLIPH